MLNVPYWDFLSTSAVFCCWSTAPLVHFVMKGLSASPALTGSQLVQACFFNLSTNCTYESLPAGDSCHYFTSTKQTLFFSSMLVAALVTHFSVAVCLTLAEEDNFLPSVFVKDVLVLRGRKQTCVFL